MLAWEARSPLLLLFTTVYFLPLLTVSPRKAIAGDVLWICSLSWKENWLTDIKLIGIMLKDRKSKEMSKLRFLPVFLREGKMSLYHSSQPML